MKQKLLTIISIFLLILLVAVSGCCAALFFLNKSQAKQIETMKTTYDDAMDQLKLWKKQAKDYEEQLNLLQSSSQVEEETDVQSEGKPEDDNPKKKPESSEPKVKYVDVTDMEAAKAKGLVDMTTVDTANLDNYFKSFPISDKLFKRIYGDDRSYKTYCTIPRESLTYLKVLHYGYDGEVHVGELICSVDISEDLLYIFRTLFENKYQIEKMVLVEEYGADDDTSVNDNNTSCFNFRYATDSTVLSNHATGRAIDINPLQNPYFRVHEDGSFDWDNVDADRYWDRSNDPENRHMITHNDLCYQLFAERGFGWGGDWTNPIDYQHFEK